MYERSVLTTAELAAVTRRLTTMPAASNDTERIDRIRSLEELRSAVAAAQAAETAAFVASQRAANLVRGVPVARAERGVASQVGLARRISTYQAQRYTGWTTILTTELPATFSALQRGYVSEWRAMIVARETAWLSRAQRAQIDTDLAPQLGDLGDRRLEAAVKQAAYRLDPQGYLDRLATAESERRVGLRPAPDLMTRLTALLPMAQGVAAYAALRSHADSLTTDGDTRGRGQLMADTLVERLTGQAVADEVPVEVELIMTDTSLLAGDDEPALLVGCGPVPAEGARKLVLGESGTALRWIRRLYQQPGTGQLAAMDSRRRLFPGALRRFVRLRDQGRCRTPWCDAPIRHIDHVESADEGGRTSVANSEGLCAACNYAKQALGWRARPAGPGEPAGQVILTTPTGHAYVHRPPDPPGASSPAAPPIALPAVA